METPGAFTDEEWSSLREVPMMAAVAVVTAGKTGPVQILKELTAASKAMAAGSGDPLVAALAEAAAANSEEGQQQKRRFDDADALRASAIAAVRAARELVEQKAPESMAAFGDWLLSIARSTAEAAKEGGFLGIGGARVSQAEQQVLAELESILA